MNRIPRTTRATSGAALLKRLRLVARSMGFSLSVVDTTAPGTRWASRVIPCWSVRSRSGRAAARRSNASGGGEAFERDPDARADPPSGDPVRGDDPAGVDAGQVQRSRPHRGVV